MNFSPMVLALNGLLGHLVSFQVNYGKSKTTGNDSLGISRYFGLAELYSIIIMASDSVFGSCEKTFLSNHLWNTFSSSR
jgi:hypothetical protein